MDARRARARAFNSANRWRKRGVWCTPVKYGISDGGSPSGATVSIYASDGTVRISHGGAGPRHAGLTRAGR